MIFKRTPSIVELENIELHLRPIHQNEFLDQIVDKPPKTGSNAKSSFKGEGIGEMFRNHGVSNYFILGRED
jgi:hypothetical protein